MTTSFINTVNQLNWQDELTNITKKTEQDVQRALAKSSLTIDDFSALISDAALPFIEQMALKSQQLTQQRFGKTIQLYVPLYLSNMCSNVCTYCGFSMTNKIRRKTLTLDEVEQEAKAIKALGFDHILLVTGESERLVGMAYFEQVIPLLTQYFSHITMEIQPLATEQYQQLKKLGVNSILVYQESYHREQYAKYHLKGKKADFDFRLTTAERAGSAGIDKIGLGCLLGLAPWQSDVVQLAKHLRYLEKHHWQSKYSISFPRIRPCEGETITPFAISDKQLLQLICAFRLFSPQVELSLSTRENALFRDNALALGITTMSAGSVTQPGGYANSAKALTQFSIDDNRSVPEVANAIKMRGYQVIWKDWSGAFSN
jgi:2-iminoacetate synthase